MKNDEIIYQRYIENQELEKFFDEVDNDFVPKISETYDISEYTGKLLKNAEFFIAKSKSKTIGIIAFYCNDLDSKKAHIPILGIHKNYRGLGLGGKLLNFVINYVKKLGFDTMSIETRQGSPAQFLYEKYGFKTVGRRLNEISKDYDVMMKIKFN